MRHNVAPGATNCRARLVTYGPTRPRHHPNYKRRVKRRAARHTASLYASPSSAFHALLCALRAQRVAETELGMQLRYTPRSAPLRAAQLRCANGWIKDSSVLPPAGGSSLAFPASQATQASLSNQLRWSLRSAPRRSAPRTRGVPRVSAQTLQTDPPPSLLARSSSRFVFRVWFRHKHGIKPKWE